MRAAASATPSRLLETKVADMGRAIRGAIIGSSAAMCPVSSVHAIGSIPRGTFLADGPFDFDFVCLAESLPDLERLSQMATTLSHAIGGQCSLVQQVGPSSVLFRMSGAEVCGESCTVDVTIQTTKVNVNYERTFAAYVSDLVDSDRVKTLGNIRLLKSILRAYGAYGNAPYGLPGHVIEQLAIQCMHPSDGIEVLMSRLVSCDLGIDESVRRARLPALRHPGYGGQHDMWEQLDRMPLTQRRFVLGALGMAARDVVSAARADAAWEISQDGLRSPVSPQGGEPGTAVLPRRRQGKSKDIIAQAAGELEIVFSDRVTTGNGAVVAVVPGKGEVTCDISTHLFGVLERQQVPHHLRGRREAAVMIVADAIPFPVEVVVRLVAAGSLLRRVPMLRLERLPFPLVEYFYKRDEWADPLVCEDHLVAAGVCTYAEARRLRDLAVAAAAALELEMRRCHLSLIDVKLEFGRLATGEIVLIDEVSPDVFRVIDDVSGESLDKDVFRDGTGDLLAAYSRLRSLLLKGRASPTA